MTPYLSGWLAAREEAARVADGEVENYSHYGSHDGVSAALVTAKKIRALKPPEGPEGFEEWHARECPNILSGVVTNLCGGGREGEGSLTWNECFSGYLLAMRARPDLFGKYLNRTCREVYEQERGGGYPGLTYTCPKCGGDLPPAAEHPRGAEGEA